MSTPVRLERDGDIAVIVIDNPPVNAGSLGVRQGILACIREIAADPTMRGTVLIGAGKTFIAGSDLKEFGAPIVEPQLPAVIAALEHCRMPVVAALHGAALGGGYELALGCDARVASPGTVVGLPEVTLGMIPGAGGTQRLPRVAGIANAIKLICAGTRVEAATAKDIGMIDAVAEGDLRTFAVNYARAMEGRKRRVRDITPAPEDGSAIAEATQAALKAGRQRPQVAAAINAVMASTSVPIDAALAAEREVFQQLRLGSEAFALRHLFFSEKESVKRPEFEGASARPVERIAVIGAGTMGTGIALAALAGGFSVVLLEQDQAALERGMVRLREYYAQRVAAGKMKAQEAAKQQAMLRAGTDDALLDGVQLVIEAVFEDLAVKRAVLHRLDALLPAGVILASNTSYLDLDALADATDRPQDVVGLHFFSPANVMRLLEVVRGNYTSPEVLATCFALARRLGKLPILTGNAFGFIGNRIYAAYRRQSEFMLEEGALPAQIDQAMEAFGFAMGPFAVADLSGLDIAWRMRQAQAASRNPQARYVAIPDRLCEMNRLGRKTGAGYYLYEHSGQRGLADQTVTRLIEKCADEKGIVRRAFSQQEIQRRLLLSMANEAALLLAEGVTTRVTDIDLVMVNGFGFPKWEGGPVFWACCQDPAMLAKEQERLIAASGIGVAKGELGVLSRLLPRDRIPASLIGVASHYGV
jgi:3-hydroxyacyl-CoA dehydrogenase